MIKPANLLLMLMAVGCSAQHDRAPPPSGAANPVQHEMRLLSATLETAVRAIGAGDVRIVARELHRVHAAKEATDGALRSGTYRLPKSPERVDRFRELDEAFHRKLENLVEASQRNNVAATGAAVGAALEGCQGCHAEFRW